MLGCQGFRQDGIHDDHARAGMVAINDSRPMARPKLQGHEFGDNRGQDHQGTRDPAREPVSAFPVLLAGEWVEGYRLDKRSPATTRWTNEGPPFPAGPIQQGPTPFRAWPEGMSR
jgi:hypothetical protein